MSFPPPSSGRRAGEPAIIRLHRELDVMPQVASVEGVTVRAIDLPGDVEPWLPLRDAACADLRPRPGTWSTADFHREFTGQSWFHRNRMWVAEASGVMETRHESDRNLSGAVALAVRRSAAGATAHVHWLLVHPEHRRKGLARSLMATLERACWDAGIRRISLETHRDWRAAVALYRNLGYA
jgi:GNAT superfamily N-acetyltransferase